nr:unnamed protein product [Callosobruchus chinensis]
MEECDYEYLAKVNFGRLPESRRSEENREIREMDCDTRSELCSNSSENEKKNEDFSKEIMEIATKVKISKQLKNMLKLNGLLSDE